MSDSPSLLLADDEESFLVPTAEVLRRNGFCCEPATDAEQAVRQLSRQRYDLLISDIKMPGNDGLRLLHESHRLAPGMPVILVTGHAAIESAIACVGKPVSAYLTKPVGYDRLLDAVHASLALTPRTRVLQDICERLRACLRNVETILSVPATPIAESPGLTMTLRALAECHSELWRLLQGDRPAAVPLCQSLRCPNWPRLGDQLTHASDVLKETKRRFKSKELADLRDQLERTLKALPS